MEMKMHEVKKVYFCRFDYHVDEEWGDCCNVAVTTDIDKAKKMDEHYRLANISEVNECMEDLCIDGEYIKIIGAEDGIYGYVEYSWIDIEDRYDEMFCGYVKIG